MNRRGERLPLTPAPNPGRESGLLDHQACEAPRYQALRGMPQSERPLLAAPASLRSRVIWRNDSTKFSSL